MMEENQRRQADDTREADPSLINAVTATVLQTLQAASSLPGGEHPQESKTVDLIGMFFHILEKFWIVLTGAAVCAVLMGGIAGNSLTAYSATSKLYIVNPNSSVVNIADLQLGTALTLDYQEVFKTWEVHEMVIAELDLPYTYEQMQTMLTISNPEDTRILYITVTYPDGKMAADIANAYAKAAKTFIISTMKGAEPSDFSIALEPSIGHGAGRPRSMIIGFLVGGVFTAAVLAVLFVLDDGPRSPEAIREFGGIPTLAVFPASAGGRSEGKFSARKIQSETGSAAAGNYLEITNFPEPDFGCREAMNTLCTNLSYCGKNVRKIMITSRYAREGKSCLSMNLLWALSRLGRRTILIDTDLRASSIRSEYRLKCNTKEHYGLSEYLSGQCELKDAIYRTNFPNAFLIPAGHEAPNPLQLLDTQAMKNLIDCLGEGFDVVLLDTPPAGVLADAMAMAKFCDGALLVVGYRRGKQQEIGEVVVNMKQTGCKVLGAVLNGVKFNQLSNRHHYYNSERYSGLYSKRNHSRWKKRQ